MILDERRIFKGDLLRLISQAEKRIRDLEDRVREDETRFDLSLSKIDGKLENHRSAILTAGQEIANIWSSISEIEAKIGENEPENAEKAPDFKALEADNERLRNVVSTLLDELEAKEVALMDAMDEIDHLRYQVCYLSAPRMTDDELREAFCKIQKLEKFFPTHGGADDAD